MSPRSVLFVSLMLAGLSRTALAQDHNFIRSVSWQRSSLTFDYSPDPVGHYLLEVSTSTEGSTIVRAIGFSPMPIGQYPGVGLRVNHQHGVDGLIVSIADQRRPLKSYAWFLDQRLTFTFGRRTEITQVIESYGQSVPKLTLIGFTFELSSYANRDLSQRGEFFVQGDVYPFGRLRAQAGMLIVTRIIGRHTDYELEPSARVSWATHMFRIR